MIHPSARINKGRFGLVPTGRYGGICRYDPDAPEREQYQWFTTEDGLGDDNGYAVACDRLGRIWCGHLHTGHQRL